MEVSQFYVPVDGVGKKSVSKAFTMFLLSNVKQFIPAGGGVEEEKIKISK